MNSINENNKKSKRYLPHELKTKENAVKTYRNGNSINYICRKYYISRMPLYKWNKLYDGTRESLIDKSHKPLSKHPNVILTKKSNGLKILLKEIIILLYVKFGIN